MEYERIDRGETAKSVFIGFQGTKFRHLVITEVAPGLVSQ